MDLEIQDSHLYADITVTYTEVRRGTLFLPRAIREVMSDADSARLTIDLTSSRGAVQRVSRSGATLSGVRWPEQYGEGTRAVVYVSRGAGFVHVVPVV